MPLVNLNEFVSIRCTSTCALKMQTLYQHISLYLAHDVIKKDSYGTMYTATFSLSFRMNYSAVAKLSLQNHELWTSGYTDPNNAYHEFVMCWPSLKDLSEYFMVDSTRHLESCQGLFTRYPIPNSIDCTLRCFSCHADIDIKWIRNRNALNHFKEFIIWKLWKCYNNTNMTSYIEWIHEEVLQDIFVLYK